MVDDICPAHIYGDQSFSTWNELVLLGRIVELSNPITFNTHKISVGKAEVVKTGNEVNVCILFPTPQYMLFHIYYYCSYFRFPQMLVQWHKSIGKLSSYVKYNNSLLFLFMIILILFIIIIIIGPIS